MEHIKMSVESFKGLRCLEATGTTLLRIIYTLPTPQQFCHPTLRWTGT